MTIDLEYNPGIARPWMDENPNGEWVRWEDVKDLIDLARDAVTLKVFQEFERDNNDQTPHDAYCTLLALVLSGCCQQPEMTTQHAIATEERISPTITRFENSEAVCYVYSNHNAGGLSCNWKPNSAPQSSLNQAE
jgi:hypothetical protein